MGLPLQVWTINFDHVLEVKPIETIFRPSEVIKDLLTTVRNYAADLSAELWDVAKDELTDTEIFVLCALNGGEDNDEASPTHH